MRAEYSEPASAVLDADVQHKTRNPVNTDLHSDSRLTFERLTLVCYPHIFTPSYMF
jgi:hypothetical protein